jgi:aldehyde:ferredoxin oxidoreductase
VDLASGKGQIVSVDGRDQEAGGSGLAALLFNTYGHAEKNWDESEQPLIFCIGPLTGYFPLMSKVVCAFKSPYHNQYAESHAGGRLALCLRFADLDALVITGRAKRPACLCIGSKQLEVKDVHYMWGMDVRESGKLLRKMFSGQGHRSILRIGQAGESSSAMACINVDTYRHFGRLGGGGVMGAKNLKGLVVQGDGSFELTGGKDYQKLFKKVHQLLTSTDMMDKYHNLGTPVNVAALNALQALPVKNLQQTTDPGIENISGERFAEDTLLRNTACSGCPVGCIHLGFVREKFMEPHHYLYRQVAYDHEPIFALGSMLGVTDAFKVLGMIESAERVGIDVMSAGVALAWATEALEKGLVSEKETLVSLRFGEAESYEQAIYHLALGSNDFYRMLAQGSMKAANHYGGEDFACVLGQEMAGYATGEVFFVSQALGFRHSHLDAGGYSYDQKGEGKNVDEAVRFLLADEKERVFLTSMVVCLFARGVYTRELLADCLQALGYSNLAENMDQISGHIQGLRWKTRFSTGFDPATISIPKRFSQVSNWKGALDAEFMDRLKAEYSTAIIKMTDHKTNG